MSHYIIKAKSLGKEYVLNQADEYYSFRDYLSETPRRFALKILNRFRRENFWALKNVSFELGKGDVLGVIGRNGAGKSTLLKILARTTSPTEGSAILHGRVASMLEIGTGFNAELTGRENIFLNGAILGMKKWEIDKKFNDIVEFSEIGKFLDIPVKKYSSGMYVRLAFSVAAHLDPEIVLLDEVLAVGDIPFQRKSIAKMRSIAKDEGRTVIFVSHNLASIDSLCNKAILLEKGKMTAFGKTKDVIAKYTSGFKTETNFSSSEIIRSGDGRIRFEDFWIENGIHKKTSQLKVGDRCFLNFKFSSPKGPVDKLVDMGFVVLNIVDQPLFSNYLSYVHHAGVTCPEKGVFVFEIPHIPLARGNYKIAIQASIAGKDADYLSNAAQISVIDGDFYHKGIITKQSHTPIYAEGNWIYSK